MNKLSSPFVSFVIVSWNNRDLLDECFGSLYTQSYKDFNIILVDNGSSDETVEFVKNNHPKVIVIDLKENVGFAIGNNKGIARALENKNCRFVALLNTDARIEKDWLGELVGFAYEHPKGASFQSPTLDYYDHKVLDSRGILIDYQGRAVQLGYREPIASLKTTRVFGVNAAACLYSRAFLEDQPFGKDYFDSDLWMYLEDVDLAARATMMGWENWFVNKSKAYHMGSASSSKNPGFSVYMCYRNNSLILVKNLPFSTLMRIIPGIIITDLQTLWVLVRTKNYIPAKAILKGRISSWRLIVRFLSKRRHLKRQRAISNTLLRELMSAKNS